MHSFANRRIVVGAASGGSFEATLGVGQNRQLYMAEKHWEKIETLHKVANKVKNANMVYIGPNNCCRLQWRRPAPASVLLLVVSYIVFVFKQPINQSTLKPPYLEPKPIKAGAVYTL